MCTCLVVYVPDMARVGVSASASAFIVWVCEYEATWAHNRSTSFLYSTTGLTMSATYLLNCTQLIIK